MMHDLPQLRDRLSQAGIRPTAQRLAIAARLWGGASCRHVSAEELHQEIQEAGEVASLATVYNTLHQFTRAGLLREVSLSGGRACFDTNLEPHFHYYYEKSGRLQDIPACEQVWSSLPSAPPGTDIKGVDVIIRVREGE